MFPFGFGLSYTTFEYSNLMIEKVSDIKFIAKFDIKNTGNFYGNEIAQLYAGEMNPTVERPIKELKGFEKKFIPHGETRSFSIPLNTEQLGFYNVDTNLWKSNKGKYIISIGSSSVDLKLIIEIEI